MPAWRRRRRECGYTADDNGRMLAVLARTDLRGWAVKVSKIRAPSLCRAGSFLSSASLAPGRARLSHNRLVLSNAGGSTTRGSDDSYGRALWGLGTLAARSFDADLRQGRLPSSSGLTIGWRVPHPRSVDLCAPRSSRDGRESTTRSVFESQIRKWIGQLPGPSGRPW